MSYIISLCSEGWYYTIYAGTDIEFVSMAEDTYVTAESIAIAYIKYKLQTITNTFGAAPF